MMLISFIAIQERGHVHGCGLHVAMHVKNTVLYLFIVLIGYNTIMTVVIECFQHAWPL